MSGDVEELPGAACKGAPDPENKRDMLRRCDGYIENGVMYAPCPVREACLRQALKLEEGLGYKDRHGVWGGKNPRERLRIAQEGPCPRCGGAIDQVSLNSPFCRGCRAAMSGNKALAATMPESKAS